MNKDYQLTFYVSELNQCQYILNNSDIKNEVALFLLKYVTLESFYKKLLTAEKEKGGKKLTQKERRDLRVVSSDVHRVLKYFDIDCDEGLVDRIFGSNDSSYMDCSIKKLRDRLVHNVNDNVLRTILERYTQASKDMDDFLNLFAKQAKVTK